jgi:hypothetical protein
MKGSPEMNKICLAMAAAGLIGFMSSGSALANRLGERQAQQSYRIHQGVRSGELTRSETRALIREQQHIQHMRYRALADGRLKPRERMMLEHRQHMASAHINRLKNNGRAR